MSRTDPRLPIGCDYQGRHPEAGHACSEFLTEDDWDEYVDSRTKLSIFLIWIVAVAAVAVIVFF